MKRKMYELIAPSDQLPMFWMDNDEKVLRQMSDPKAIASMYYDIERYHWSVKDGWKTNNKYSNTLKLTIPMSSVNSEDFVPFVREQVLHLDSRCNDIEGNYIVAHRCVGNITHVGVCIYDAITERPVHWLD